MDKDALFANSDSSQGVRRPNAQQVLSALRGLEYLEWNEEYEPGVGLVAACRIATPTLHPYIKIDDIVFMQYGGPDTLILYLRESDFDIWAVKLRADCYQWFRQATPLDFARNQRTGCLIPFLLLTGTAGTLVTLVAFLVLV